MVKRFLPLLIFISSILTFNNAFAQQPSLVQLKTVTDRCLNLIKDGKFKEAAEMFHIPPTYTAKEMKSDCEALRLGLQEITKIFGSFKSIDLLKEPAVYINIPIGGGDLAYWNKHPASYKLEYKTEFQNEGPGFVVFHLVNISKVLEIKTIAYGISAVEPNARERMTRIGEHMMKFMMRLSQDDDPKTGI